MREQTGKGEGRWGWWGSGGGDGGDDGGGGAPGEVRIEGVVGRPEYKGGDG